jgi:hypothetical protein
MDIDTHRTAPRAMDKVIVLIDDVAYARDHLRPMLGKACGAAPATLAAQRTHWVVVACAPRITQRVSKWVSHRAREHWRSKWSDKLFAELIPWLQSHGDAWTAVVATGPLPDLTQGLMTEHGTTHVLDVRRPKLSPGQSAPPAGMGQQHWSLAGVMAGLGLVLGLGLDGFAR